MRLKFGSINTIVVSSPEIAQKILQKHDNAFPGRLKTAATQVLSRHDITVSCLPVGGKWRILRKICREQMFSAQRLDSSRVLRREKVDKLLDYVNECCVNGRVVDIGEAAFVTSLNLISNTLFSVDFAEYKTGSSQELKGIIHGLMSVIGRFNLADYIPILGVFDPQGIKRESEFYMRKLIEIFDGIIDEREKSTAKKNDLLEALMEISDGNQSDQFSRNDMKHLLLIPSSWSFLLRQKDEDELEINNYTISKNSVILINIWATGRDSRTWPNPNSFEPERFLNGEIDVKGHNFELIPFGAGKRICPGLPLAHRMVHLMVASLIQEFDWELEPGLKSKEMDMNEKFGLSLQKAVPLRAVPNKQ
ncbi:hypothetical protein DH2020_027260 [Rehmannia glutinosa]|uniref:Uncharacterized protein n=1 Tax=Rehmannia glutinosa TaxID=99300 RepID=A0ABR0VXL5_REHGL